MIDWKTESGRNHVSETMLVRASINRKVLILNQIGPKPVKVISTDLTEDCEIFPTSLTTRTTVFTEKRVPGAVLSFAWTCEKSNRRVR